MDQIEVDKAKLIVTLDRLIELASARYGIEPHEAIEAIRWVQEHKEWAGKMRSASWIGLVTILLSALGVALWEGIKSIIITRGHP